MIEYSGLATLAQSLRNIQMEIEHYPWPNPDWSDYPHIAEGCEKYEKYAIVSGGWCPISDDICHLNGNGSLYDKYDGEV